MNRQENCPLNIYLSGPLFSRGEIAWAGRVKAFLEDRIDGVKVIWPHEIVSCSCGKREIFETNLKALNESDVMVALLDGPQVDDGTAWEIGYFFSHDKKIFGIRTDFRRAGETESSIVNLMIECSCLVLVSGLDELARELQRISD